MSRKYDNSTRAEQAARTNEAIGEATEQLLASSAFGSVTLQTIAERAGVTVQTVIRHMGSREGCMMAARDRVAARISEQRGHTAPGDFEGAIREVVDHYEAEGRLVLNLLAQEGAGDSFADEAASAGRTFHRAWVERCFEVSDKEVVDAIVAATDLYVWKLFRLDLGRSYEDTRNAIRRLVYGVLEST